MIRDVLDALPSADRARLELAHKAGLPQYIEYEPGHYIGVHVRGTPHLVPTEKVGDWAIGKVKRCN